MTCDCAADAVRIDGASVDHLNHHDHSADASSRGNRRMVPLEQVTQVKNTTYAISNRASLAKRWIFALNLFSNPSSGKTTLLRQTISQFGTQSVAVFEGDQQARFDTKRIGTTGASVVQISTDKGCHFGVHMVGYALQLLALRDDALLIENIGNLDCPTAFDLGEAHKVVILLVTEGEDKPSKYPDMYRDCDAPANGTTPATAHITHRLKPLWPRKSDANPFQQLG